MKNLMLLLVAIILALILFPLGFVFTIFEAIRRRKKTKFFTYLSKACREGALAIDRLGNVVCRDMLNAFFIKHGGYYFGRQGETISSALGRNLLRGTLTKAGRLLASILDFIDPNHCINSIDYSLS